MPFDGVVVKSVIEELSYILINSRIEKIFQPERDEIIINVRANRKNLKLVLSANPNNPRIHITKANKKNPDSPPMFCMLLRKHLSGAKIININFHDYERIISIEMECTDELGDMSIKKLIIEIMGRHSNIILLNKNNKIIDSIKHIDNEISSVREVMPARLYSFPPSQDKVSPDKLDIDSLLDPQKISFKGSVEKYLLNSIKGFSPLLCKEVCFRASIDGKINILSLSPDMLNHLKNSLYKVIKSISDRNYSPCLIFKENYETKPLDFHCLPIYQYKNVKSFDSINQALDLFYMEKDNVERLKQKKSFLFKVINNRIERCNKKLALHQDKLREVADREKFKLYGELITANIYAIPKNSKNVKLLNYYNTEKEEYVNISMDENLSAQENAQKYFKKYSKSKIAFEYTNQQLEETRKELDYLESVILLLENSSTIAEIEEIREELTEQGYLKSKIKYKNKYKKNAGLSSPLHYKSSDGFDIFVGKNNKQNDYLTLKKASSKDLWLHTKNIPGSHVIIKKREKEISNKAIEEASILAAYHSKARMSSNVPVDYTIVKNVKKPSGAKPGMVIYENYKTIVVTPTKEKINNLNSE